MSNTVENVRKGTKERQDAWKDKVDKTHKQKLKGEVQEEYAQER